MHKRFQYNFTKKNSTIVEFDIVEERGKKVAKNLTLTSNFRGFHHINPEINFFQGEYHFAENGILSTNGDIQQIIKRIFQMVDEAKA